MLAQPFSERCKTFAQRRLEAALGRFVVTPVAQGLGKHGLVGYPLGERVRIFIPLPAAEKSTHRRRGTL